MVVAAMVAVAAGALVAAIVLLVVLVVLVARRRYLGERAVLSAAAGGVDLLLDDVTQHVLLGLHGHHVQTRIPHRERTPEVLGGEAEDADGLNAGEDFDGARLDVDVTALVLGKILGWG